MTDLGPDNRGPSVSARLGEELDEEFVAFVEENDMTIAEAMRHLIRTGLVEKGEAEYSYITSSDDSSQGALRRLIGWFR